MKVLVIGSGGREHAIAWKLAQSDQVEKIYAVPGNGGTAAEKKCENLPFKADPAVEAGQEELVRFARKEKIGLTVVGPEAPLAAGIVDRFRGAELAVIGPGKKAALLEASKIYAKSFMKKYGVRTAKSHDFTAAAEASACAGAYFAETKNPPPLVVKADGLAAGKGVIVAETFAEAEAAISSFMRDRALGDAGSSVVLEEFLEGKEVSVLAAVSVNGADARDKGEIVPFIAARDHKRRFDGGKGPNTGGMGSIAPVPDFDAAARADFQRAILEPTLRGLKAENMDYRGFIFFGLMLREGQSFLLEYNVRLGDPETQAVLPLMDSDLAGLCAAILKGTLGDFPLKWKNGAVCAPVAVAGGYPGPYRTGAPITINSAVLERTGAQLFIAGARRETEGPPGSGLRSSGGRILAVSSYGNDADEAWTRAYRALEAIHFEGMDFRRDIGRENASGGNSI